MVRERALYSVRCKLYVPLYFPISLILSALWRVWHFLVTALSSAHTPLYSRMLSLSLSLVFFSFIHFFLFLAFYWISDTYKRIHHEVKRSTMWFHVNSWKIIKDENKISLRYSLYVEIIWMCFIIHAYLNVMMTI